LQGVVDYRKVTAIVISHMHFDHFADLIPYTYGLKLGVPLTDGYRPTLYLPPNGKQILGKVVEQWPDLGRLVFDAFEVHEFDPEKQYTVGPLQVNFISTLHYVPCWGVSVIESGKKLAYSADAGPSEALKLLAAGADLLLCEAALEARSGPGAWGHLSAKEAGETAATASVKRLLLTHTWGHFDRARMLAEARDAFKGPVEFAEEMKSYFIA